VAAPGQVLQPISAVQPANEPDTHRSTTWLAEHRGKFDETCDDCHTVDSAGGSDNVSFCSNAACHATEWRYAGLNAPQIRELFAAPSIPSTGKPNPIPHPVSTTTDCDLCHGADKVRPFPENHAGFPSAMCAGCHPPALKEQGETPAPFVAPTIPHQLEGVAECQMCHALDGMKPFPENHTAFTVDVCTNCHKLASESESAPDATPEAVPEPTPGTGVVSAPTIPHDTLGRDNCLACHAVEGGVKPAPQDHAGRTSDSCQGCHQPAS